MTKKPLLLISTAVLFTLIFSACRPFNRTTDTTPSPTPPTAAMQNTNSNPAAEPGVDENGKKKSTYELTANEDGIVALELLEANADVQTKDYGEAGKFVTSINGLEGDNSYYWAFYLNGKYAEQGVTQTTLKKGDIIKFVYEAVSLTK